METGYFHMSQKELERLKVIDKVLQKELSQVEASRQLKVTSRQIRRLLACYKEHGAAGLISKHRNKPGNHRKPTGVKQQVISLIKEKYSDFGPTLASEYLEQLDSIKLSSETVRLWMISEGLWQPKNKKGLKRAHQHRERRSQFGELIQLDGSPHDWFEGRANKCCLLVIIDDATSALLGLRFCHAETTQDYFALMDSYIKAYGLPMSAYTDKHGIFRINDKRHEGARLTQFGRALNELGVELIHASSPQAKGRVERVNKTLQDRLIKWLRLKKISTMEDANKVLNEYILEHNTKFAKPAKNKTNAHIAMTETPQKLKHILSVKTEKKLSKSLSFQHEKKLYQIKEKGKNRLQNKQVILIESYDGESAIYHNDKRLEFECIEVQTKAGELHDEKTINHAIDELKTKASSEFTPGSSNEPWNDYKIIEKQIAFLS